MDWKQYNEECLGKFFEAVEVKDAPEGAGYDERHAVYVSGCNAASKLHGSINGGTPGTVRDAYFKLSELGKKRIRLAIAMIAHAWAMERMNRIEKTGEPDRYPDMRTKESKNFAWAHDNEFFTVLKDAGILSERGCTDHLPYCKMTLDEMRAYRESWVAGFVSEWIDRVHPTYQQVLFKELLSAFVKEGLYKFDVPYFHFY